jgi:hypothetical protein
MEIALLSKSVVKIKGKYASFVVNPQDATAANAALLLDTPSEYESEESVILNGAGEYEIGGVKITGLRHEKGIVYTLHVDGMAITVGSSDIIVALQHKLKESNFVIAQCNEAVDVTPLASLAVNALIFYGEKAQEVAEGFEKEKLQKMNKFTTTLGKLSSEMETILLA